MSGPVEGNGRSIDRNESFDSLNFEPIGEHKGRSCKDVTKTVAKVIGGIALALVGAVAIAALIVGIMMLVNPTGFGIGNAIGGVLAKAGAVLGAFVIKAAGFVSAHALLVTLVGAGSLGLFAAGTAGLAIATKAKSKPEDGEDLPPPDEGFEPKDERPQPV